MDFIMAHFRYLSLSAILFCTCVSINNDKYADVSGKYVASYIGKRYLFKPDRTFDTIPLTQDSLINCKFYSYDLISGSDTFDFPYDLDTLTIINEHSGRYLTRACSLHVYYNKIALISSDVFLTFIQQKCDKSAQGGGGRQYLDINNDDYTFFAHVSFSRLVSPDPQRCHALFSLMDKYLYDIYEDGYLQNLIYACRDTASNYSELPLQNEFLYHDTYTVYYKKVML